MNLYLKEARFLKWYIITILVFIGLSYSVYAVFSANRVADLGKEDHFFEWFTAINFLIASVILFVLNLKSKNFFLLLLSISFFIGFGEEISWGQRIFHFRTPEMVEKINVQKEFSIHNLEIFNSKDLNLVMKKGLSRFLEVNFMFKVFTILFGIVLPLIVFHINFIKNLSGKLKIPVPPLSIGILFLMNWLVFRVLLSYVLPTGFPQGYYDSTMEIFECDESFIFLCISLFFYFNRSSNILGQDIKQTILA